MPVLRATRVVGEGAGNSRGDACARQERDTPPGVVRKNALYPLRLASTSWTTRCHKISSLPVAEMFMI